MIKSIELINWKTHGSTKLEFAKGTNLIIGQMGAGKSSVMDAISFGLFGTFPSMQQRRTSANGLIRSRPEKQSKATVRIRFTNGPDEYTVERNVSVNAPSSAKLEKNGAYLQSQPERVTEEVEKALKIDYDLFSKAVYSEQNAIGYFLDIRAAERKKLIDEFLGLDKFANSYEVATTVINRIKEMASEAEKLSSSLDVKGIRDQINALEKESGEFSKKLEEAKKEAQRLVKEKDSTQRRLDESSKAYERKLLLENQLKELEGRLSTLKTEIDKIDKKKVMSKSELAVKLKNATDQIAELTESESKAIEAERKLQSAKAKLEAEAAKLGKDSTERERMLKELGGDSSESAKKRLDAHSRELEQLLEKGATVKGSIAEREKALKDLREHIGKCPVCEQELEDGARTKLISKNQALVSQLSSELVEAERLSSSKKKELESLGELSKRVSVIEERLKEYANLEKEISAVSKKLKDAETETESSKKRSEEARKALLAAKDLLGTISAEMEMASRREEYEKETAAALKSIEPMKREASSIKVEKREIDAIQESLSKLSSELARLDSERSSTERYIGDRAKQITEKRKELARIEEMTNEIASKKELAENLAKFRNSLQETQAMLRSRLVSSINETMQEIWPQLYPYGDYAGIMLDATENDYVLKLQSRINGEDSWDEVEAIASGGERSTACLAMRIAMSLVLVPNLKWLILDEPTHNIDQQGLSKFIEVFNDTLPRIVDQIFIITHDEALKQVSNAKIYLLNRNKELHEQTSAVEL